MDQPWPTPEHEAASAWAPPEVDLRLPSAARMYDYFLGGSHNFQVDRDIAEQVLAAVPDFPATARANRSFLRRAVCHLIDQGVRQFLDLGSGIPTVGNVHEIAQRAAPDARVVYVDVDPVAVEHSRLLLAGNQQATVVRHDIRHPNVILADPHVTGLLDLDAPLGVLMASVLHFIPDADNPHAIINDLRQAIAADSYLVLSHGTTQARPTEGGQIMRLYQQTSNPLTNRSREQIMALFAGFDLLDPGLVWAPQWRPDPGEQADQQPERCSVLAAVGRKQGP